MSNVYFISDLHIGHKNILGFSGDLRLGDTTEQHDAMLIHSIATVCSSKRDILYILGDVCFEIEKMEMLDKIPARKILVRGNHDCLQLDVYAKYFEDVLGMVRYKGYWLTHSPIHPDELRGRKNIHGHVHQNTVKLKDDEVDSRYINVCVENCQSRPVNFQLIKAGEFKGVCE